MNFLKTKNGFTLIELLAVVAILGILITLVTTAVQFSIINAKRQQRRTQMNALATAVITYKHDHNKWPLEDTSIDRFKLGDYTWTNDNWSVFGALMVGSSQNPSNKTYLDYNAFYVLSNNNAKSIMKLADYLKTSGNTLQKAIVDFEGNPFLVRIADNLIIINFMADGKYEGYNEVSQ